MTDWKDIHEDFGKESYRVFGETYQQLWEQVNFTKEEVKEWIKVGFEPRDLDKVEQWKNCSFSPTETKIWLEVGLKKYEGEFTSWLRTNNYTPELVKNNLEQLRNDYKEFRTNNSQVWLEQVYTNNNIKELDIRDRNLKGELNLRNYQQLEELHCSFNKLTNIILSTNPITYEIRNQDFIPTSLKKLDLRSNKFNQNLSFLVSYTNLENLYLGNDWNDWQARFDQGIYNKFTGSLDYLSDMKQLKWLDIDNTDINEVNIDKLPRSLKRIEYSTKERPDCKLTEIIPLLDKYFGKHGRCFKCWLANTSENWCQPCTEEEWQQLEGQELINKFIEQQKSRETYGYNELKWIPYEEFTDIKHLADGGFSKIYKAEWGEYEYDDRIVVLKSLNNSQNITFEFLTEIANTKLVENGGYIVSCHGISQDPTTKNHLMVMDYKEGGNLRQYLQNKDSRLSLKDKLKKLKNIAEGLESIHNQNLVHQDFHSGNILNSSWESHITDLGLSRPVNHLKKTGQIFGVLPYVAPEVLRGETYTQKADIYGFGIVAYELLTNAYPYPEMNETELMLEVCLENSRPDLDKVSLPQLLKDLIKRCWDSNPEQRPSAEELYDIISSWIGYDGKIKKNTPFCQQYKEIKAEYNTFSKNTPYQIHPTAITTSKMIDTRQITELLSNLDHSLELRFKNIISYQTKELGFDIKTPISTQEITKRIRSMSMEEANQKEYKASVKQTKLVKLEREQKYYSEPMEIAESNSAEQIDESVQSQVWKDISPNFTNELIKSWQSYNFNHQQTQEWINIGLQPTDYNFCAWLRDAKQVDAEQVLNHGNLGQLNQEYFQWWQEQQQT